jgi:hypothetical protein
VEKEPQDHLASSLPYSSLHSQGAGQERSCLAARRLCRKIAVYDALVSQYHLFGESTIMTVNIQKMRVSDHLDLIRGLAAIAVLFYHVRYRFFFDYHDITTPSYFSFVFYTLSSFGHDAVMIFFVLSGYFISASACGDGCDSGILLQCGDDRVLPLCTTGDEQPGGEDGPRACRGAWNGGQSGWLCARRDGVITGCNCFPGDPRRVDQGLDEHGMGSDNARIDGEGEGRLDGVKALC